jgi:hypothetical protein
MSIVSGVENGVRDIRRELPKLMADIGVNESDEHQVFHAAIIWIVSELAKLAPAGVEAVIDEIAAVV